MPSNPPNRAAASRGCAFRSPLQLRLRATGRSSTSPRGGTDVHCDGGRRAGHHIYLRKRENTSKTRKRKCASSVWQGHDVHMARRPRTRKTQHCSNNSIVQLLRYSSLCP
ncbi:hypothetical protein TcCL_NonESM05813 [Trypanosoma cruzi]|nr:hypothetical protein TcCL_NonESM05813 [Trypanosoma cruzi]